MLGVFWGKKNKALGFLGLFEEYLGFDVFPDPVRKRKHQFGFPLRKCSNYAKI